MFQHRLPGRISFLMLWRSPSAAPAPARSRAPVPLHQLLAAVAALPVTEACLRWRRPPVAVILPQPCSDLSFEGFRKDLGKIVSPKDRAALASKVIANGSFWIGEKGDKANDRS